MQSKRYCLEVTADFACFTRPEMKVERVTYDVITPSAARAVFDAIFWKPAIRWHVRRIEVLKPIRWINLRRNEVASKVSVRNVEQAMSEGAGELGLYVEDDRQQRAGLFLRTWRTVCTPTSKCAPTAATPSRLKNSFQSSSVAPNQANA